jgi:hypothetical protein
VLRLLERADPVFEQGAVRGEERCGGLSEREVRGAEIGGEGLRRGYVEGGCARGEVWGARGREGRGQVAQGRGQRGEVGREGAGDDVGVVEEGCCVAGEDFAVGVWYLAG